MIENADRHPILAEAAGIPLDDADVFARAGITELEAKLALALVLHDWVRACRAIAQLDDPSTRFVRGMLLNAIAFGVRLAKKDLV